MLNLEKKTKFILSLIVSVTFLSYIFTGFGNTTAVIWLNVAFGVLLALLIYTEVGIVTYFRQGKYKSIQMGDFLVLGGAVLATAVLLNSIFFIQAIRNVAPQGLLNFLAVNSAISGAIAGLIALSLIWTPKPKA